MEEIRLKKLHAFDIWKGNLKPILFIESLRLPFRFVKYNETVGYKRSRCTAGCLAAVIPVQPDLLQPLEADPYDESINSVFKLF